MVFADLWHFFLEKVLSKISFLLFLDPKLVYLPPPLLGTMYSFENGFTFNRTRSEICLVQDMLKSFPEILIIIILLSLVGIRHLGAASCASEFLTVLELDNCPLITDLSLHHLINCHNLQRIELYDCQLITRAGIRRLRNHLPNVRVHAYFAPITPPPSANNSRQRFCRCCNLL